MADVCGGGGEVGIIGRGGNDGAELSGGESRRWGRTMWRQAEVVGPS
jgi:hypothetical protein